MKNLNIKLEIDELTCLIEDAVRQRLTQKWGMSKEIMEDAVISVKINADRDGEVTDADVTVAPREPTVPAPFTVNFGKKKK
jgi:hypothetical protein